jgi:hypothetical protein
MSKIEKRRVSKRVAIYLRVSTTEQTTTDQRRELHAVAKRHSADVTMFCPSLASIVHGNGL